MTSNPTAPWALINNRYEVRDTLWTGGMGNVYRALDRQTQREVAIKILEGDHPIAPPRLHRFKTEFRRTPDLVPAGAWEVYDLGLEEHGLLFMTLECFPVDGPPGKAAGKAGLLDPAARDEWTGMLGSFGILDGTALTRLLEWVVERAQAERALFQVHDGEGRLLAGATVGVVSAVTDASRTSLERVRYEREPCALQQGTRTSLAVPLLDGENLLGVCYMDGQEGTFKPALLTELTHDLSLALMHDRRFRKANEDAHHLQMLNDLSRTVSSTLDLNQILHMVLEQSLVVSEAEQGAVFWGTERLATLDRHGNAVDDLRVSQSVVNRVLEEGRSLSILDTQEDEHFATQASIMDLQLRSIMCVPLRAGQITRGVLYVSSQSVARTFGPHDLEVLEGIAGQVTLALENAQAYKTIRELNLGLEDKVEQRTAELQEALRELQKMQAQLVQAEKMSSLGQMVAGVAHELNNPLNFIFGNLKVLRDYTQDMFGLLALYDKTCPADSAIQAKKESIDYSYLAGDVGKTIESCLNGTTRSQKIVADLKVFSGHDEAELKPVDLKEGLESAVAMVQGRFADRGVAYRFDLADVPQIMALGKQLNQVFLALLTNASQAIVGSGEVQVGLHQEGDQAVIVIKDSGVGIDSAHLSKIFDPFFTTRAVGEGTGLGLTTAYSVVERHNGTLSVTSTLGEGTTMTMKLPLAGLGE